MNVDPLLLTIARGYLFQFGRMAHADQVMGSNELNFVLLEKDSWRVVNVAVVSTTMKSASVSRALSTIKRVPVSTSR